jgi:hypothetical protein
MKPVVAIPLAALVLACTSQAAPISYYAVLNGVNEAPPNSSPGTGLAHVSIDLVTNLMHVDVSFEGLTVGNTAAHIHCCTPAPFTGTAGVATSTPTFIGFPTGATSGFYSNNFDLTLALSYNPAFVTAQGSIAQAEAALANGMAAGTTYLNIHTGNFPNGEIRGFLQPVPEPATFVIGGAALLCLAAMRMKRSV